MISRSFRVTGMHCAACELAVRKALMLEPDILEARANAAVGTVELDLLRDVPLERLKQLVQRTGSYAITEEVTATTASSSAESSSAPASSYYPLFLIATFITGTSLLVQWPWSSFDVVRWMGHFMAGFFLVFSFFKLLNIRGFANSYAMYDPLARRWRAWGILYPFLELGLGVLFLTGIAPTATAWTTVVLMGVGSIGPIASVLNKRSISCACLGTVFNLPMSTITIAEDLLMVAMSIGMLVH